MIEVRSLLCHRHVDMAIVCLGSLLRFSHDPIQLILHDDGSLTEADLGRLQRKLNAPKIVSRLESDALMDEALAHYPYARQSRYQTALRLKLLDIPLMSTGDIAYCDSDILFFRPFCNLFHWPDADTSAIFMADRAECYSVRPSKLVGRNRFRLPSRVNGGLFYIRKQDYDLDFVEWFLSQPDLSRIPFWAMQTCFAALGCRIGLKLWRKDQIAIPTPHIKVRNHLIAAHFVTTVRYLIKEYEEQLNHISDQTLPVPIESVSATQECNLLELMGKQFIHYEWPLMLNHMRSIKQRLTPAR